jgi:HrpA-like RNA helicase
MLLEDCAAAGRACRVLCSQPRRISAVSVASRVAEERGERVGQTAGYSIRLESAASNDTALLFVTTGAAVTSLL